MNITLDFPGPLKKGVVGKFSEAVGLTKAPPLKCFGGQIFSQNGSCGSVRVAVTEKRDRIVMSTNYNNAHMDLSRWFPGGKQERNQFHYQGA